MHRNHKHNHNARLTNDCGLCVVALDHFEQLPSDGKEVAMCVLQGMLRKHSRAAGNDSIHNRHGAQTHKWS